MKVIGILTQDFRAYHDLVQYLKGHDLQFESLRFDENIPLDVGVVITTTEERDMVESDKVVTLGASVEDAVAIAMRTLSGKESFSSLIIGIDPGPTPGVALVGDGEELEARQLDRPEGVVELMDHVSRVYPAKRLTVRIGHGDPTNRNRIINALGHLDLDVQIVDETRSTGTDGSDIEAAKRIAMFRGQRAARHYEIEPTEGELRDIKRRSRRASGGKVTISQELAIKVARGELTINEAVLEMEKKDARQKER